MSELDNLSIIQQQLALFGGPQKTANEWQMVVCPFHADRTPSMGVYMSYAPHSRGFQLGDCNCLGCGKRASWNEFAKETGLEQIDAWKSKEQTISDRDILNAEDQLLGNDTYTLKYILKTLGAPEAQPWIEKLKWRGFNGKLLKRVGGYIANDNFNESVSCIFPISIFGKYRGGVKAVYERKGKQLGYVSMRGEWVKTYGLFPFDPVLRGIKKHNLRFVFLVEGPRDALKLISLGIPALAVLGTQNISDKKLNLVKSMGIDTLYVMTDNDSAGDSMWRKVKKLATDTNCRRLKLPCEFDEHGKLIKMDPNSMPKEVVDKLINILRKRHAYPN